MQFRFWHVDPLKEDIRGSFELPEWPFYNGEYGPLPDELINYFQDLTIIRMEAESYRTKFMIPLKEDRGKGIEVHKWGPVYDVYRSSCELDENTLLIDSWDSKHPDFNISVKGKHEDIPDSYSWYEWNKKIRVATMNSKLVHMV